MCVCCLSMEVCERPSERLHRSSSVGLSTYFLRQEQRLLAAKVPHVEAAAAGLARSGLLLLNEGRERGGGLYGVLGGTGFISDRIWACGKVDVPPGVQLLAGDGKSTTRVVWARGRNSERNTERIGANTPVRKKLLFGITSWFRLVWNRGIDMAIASA